MSKNRLVSVFMKIRPLGASIFLAGRQTDITKLIVALRDFANVPKKAKLSLHAGLEV